MLVPLLGQVAAAGSAETVRGSTAQGHRPLRLAQSSAAPGATDANAVLEVPAKEDTERRGQVKKAAADAGAAKAKPVSHPGPANDESLYPTASQCGECHKQIYEEWSSSQHAYASISPMFHKFEQKFQELTKGTVGTFCVRCHQQVGTQLGEARETPLWARSQISREGVSCITCHRVKEQYGKVNGERRVEPGRSTRRSTAAASRA